ncbi:MAG: LPXTG cell wall anchor domain-containing protein [Coriobacteriales bacterium]|jgi:LPXTG-motif cell wall-anchored protein|nr:LPXTG cell wall anchor domain-containing protein [Coriobacteriales bacterium]
MLTSSTKQEQIWSSSNRFVRLGVAVVVAVMLMLASGAIVAHAADGDVTVSSLSELDAALDNGATTSITLAPAFYTDANTSGVPIEIDRSSITPLTISGTAGNTLSVGIQVSSSNVSLEGIDISLAMTNSNAPQLAWSGSSAYGAAILVDDGLANVAIRSCDISVTNTSSSVFTAGVVIAGGTGITVADNTISATGRGVSAVQGLLFFELGDNTTVTGNTLSAAHATYTAGEQDARPASALLIQVGSPNQPTGLDFSGNTLQGGSVSNAAPYSFFINVWTAAGRGGDPEMVESGFADYDHAGIRPWITDERNTSAIYQLTSSLVEQAGASGYGFVCEALNGKGPDAVTEGYTVTNGEVTAIDFWGYSITNGAYETADSSARVDASGVYLGPFQWSSTPGDGGIQRNQGSNITAGTFPQIVSTELTYTAVQTGGANNTTTSTGITVTFDHDLTTPVATAIMALVSLPGGDSAQLALADDGDGDDATWLVNLSGFTSFANGEVATLDLFGVQDYPVTTPVTSVTLYVVSYQQQTLRDTTTGISVTGSFSPGTTLVVGNAVLDSGPACTIIRDYQNSGLLYALYDLSLDNGSREPGTKVLVSFPVGADNNDRRALILHCNGGVLEKVETTVAGASVSGSFSSLSPFGVVLLNDTLPKAGDTATPSLLAATLLCALAAAVLMVRRRKAARR